MSMSKKDFIALADTLRTLQPSPFSGDSVGNAYQFDCYVNALADFCAAQNPRFNRARWLGYINGTCGPNGGTPKT